MSVNIYNADTDSLKKVATNLYSDDKVSEVENKVDSVSNEVDSLSNDIDQIKEDIPFKLGIDANGNYGYYKAGADTVTPFKKGFQNGITIGSGSQTVGFTAVVGHYYLISCAGNQGNTSVGNAISGATIISQSNGVYSKAESGRYSILRTVLVKATSTTVQYSVRSSVSDYPADCCITYIDVTNI